MTLVSHHTSSYCGLAVILALGTFAVPASAQAQAEPTVAEIRTAITNRLGAVPDEVNLILSNIVSTTLSEVIEGSRTRSGRDNVQVGQSVIVKAGEEVRDVVITSGNADVDGTVNGDLVVVLGQITLGPNAVVRGQLVSVAGLVKADPKAVVKGDVVILAGKLEAEPDALIHKARSVVMPQLDFSQVGWLRDWQQTFPKLKMAVDWVQHGLMMGRPFPPQLRWAWGAAVILFLVHLLMAVMFPRPVQACADALDTRPIGSFFTGLLVLLLFLPAVIILFATGIGILALPFVFCALALALVFGKVAVYRHTGQSVGRQLNLVGLQHPLVALLLGTGILYLLYVIPIVGLLAWVVFTIFGLGNATLAALGGMRREGSKAVGVRAEAALPGQPPPVLQEASAWVRVGFWRRFIAMALDVVLVGFVVMMMMFLMHSILRVRHVSPLPLVLLFWLAYHVGMWTLAGTTVGGLAMRIKLVREDGRALGFTLSLVRALASVFSALVFGFGFFWAGWTRGKRSWHDVIAGSLMVKVPRGVLAV